MRVLIFGRAVGVWDEVKAARELCDYDRIIGVGSAGVDYPGAFDDWVSFHTEFFHHWVERRFRLGYPPVNQFWSCFYRNSAFVKREVAVNYVRCEGGSSGLVAVTVALEALKADKVVLAGIPLVAEQGQYDTAEPWREANQHRIAWTLRMKQLQNKVKSFSGWTAQQLGKPTAEWLA